jgi:hypothetical protein
VPTTDVGDIKDILFHRDTSLLITKDE